MFHGYYAPTETQLQELWSRGTIVLDTNVLLNLYRYPVAARDDILTLLQSVQERLWIPHHVALEYHRNRDSVIRAQLEVFEKVKRVLSVARIERELDGLQLRRRHSLISADSVLNEIKPALERFEAELSELEDEHVKSIGPDPIRDSLDRLIGNKIGPAPSQSDLDALYREGETRYAAGIPPGGADEKDKKKSPAYVHQGVTYRPMYGDLILWKQLISHAMTHKLKHVLLISDDEKDDWRAISEYRGRRQVMPRPELVEEIHREAGVEVFMIYSSDSFLHVAKEKLGAELADTTIPQVADVKAAARVDQDPRMSDEHLGLLQVLGAEGNRRDAVLTCGFCHQSDIGFYFYEGDGTPRLSEVLGFFHYWDCPAYEKGTPVHLMILRQNAEPALFTWKPLPHQRL